MSDAKATLGGVIDSAKPVKIGATTYLLVTQRPYAGGEQQVVVLKPFAGKYTILWKSPPMFGDGLLGADITDLNRDGTPEVYVASEEAGNASGVDTYALTDLATNTKYTVEVDFSQDGSPGTIFPGKSLDAPSAARYRDYLEARVATNAHLKDTRNAFSKASDAWYDRYGSFLNKDVVGPMVVSPITASYGSELCSNLSGSVMSKTSLDGIEYRSIFKFGVMSFNPKTRKCAVLLATPGDSPDRLSIVKGEVYIPLGYTGSTAVWNPKKQTLRWK